MKRIALLPFILFLLISLLFFYQTLLYGKLPIAADTIVGLYHPYRDLLASDYPNGIPFKNFLVTDPVRQQYPWRMLSIESLRNAQLPLWNPYNGAGTPLLANFQSGAFYPLNILFFVLPFASAWAFLVGLQILLAAIFMYFYLRFLKLHTLACYLGAISFSFSGFAIAWLEWNTILQTALWIPLMLLAKEHFLRKKELKWMGMLIFSECSLILAGHLQTAFYSLVVINVYLFVRVYQLAKSDSLKKTFLRFLQLYKPFVFIGLCVGIITSIQWFPTLQLIFQSARNLDQGNWQQEGWFIPWQHLIQFVAPDFFGNPSTLNYWGTWNYGELVGYIGIIPLIMALFALFFRRDKKTAFFGTLFFLSLIFSLPTFFAKIPFILPIPFLSSAQPTRLLFLTDFSLAILASLGFDMFLSRKKEIFYPVFFIAVIIGGLWLVGLYFSASFGVTPDQVNVIINNLKLPSILFAVSFFVILLTFLVRNKYSKQILSVILIVITALDLIRFGLKFTPFSKASYLYPNTKTTDYLKTDMSLYRIMATDSRILPPNFSIIYKIQSVDLYDPLYLLRFGEFIAAMERSSPNIQPPFGFNRIVTPHNFDSALINLLNIKYVLSFSDISSERFQNVSEEGNTKVFENRDVLPRTFFVENVIEVSGKEDAIQSLLQGNFDFRNTAVVENENGEKMKQTHFSVGSAEVIAYTENTVTIRTRNSGEGFLFISDVYYPIWKASILNSDGNRQQARIYRTNYLFRGVIIPPGEHDIVFSTSIF